MNKKGYTLIELLAVIVVIALISTIVVLLFDNSVNKSKNKKISSYDSDLENAACVYVDLKEAQLFKASCYSSSTCTVTVAQLIESGMVSSDSIDPVTNQKINPSLTITVAWDNQGTKTCTLNR